MYLFVPKEEGREKERESYIDVRHIHQLPLVGTWTWDQTRNPGMCPNQELNL